MIAESPQTTEQAVPVVVIGGGPGGATTSTLIAQQGYKVQLFEREHFPRFHIGESLIPETYWVLERLGMLDKMKNSPFINKYSVQFVTATGKLSEPFYFVDHKPHDCSRTWQVVRSEFDKMMLDNAREHGVEVHEGTRVLEVLMDQERAVGVRVMDDAGNERVVRAQVVVDASGQSGLIASRLKLREIDPLLKKGALWTYFKGAYRDVGRDEGATIVLQTKEKKGWFWYIPLHNNIVSVGIVSAFEELFKDRRPYEQVYAEQLDLCPAVKERVSLGTREGGFFATKDYSYRSRVASGDGWVLVGRRLRVPRSVVFVRRATRAALGHDGRRRDRRRIVAGRHFGRAVGQMGAGVQPGHGPHAASGVRILRRFQLRPLREEVSALQGASDRSVDRRPVQGLCRRSGRADERDPR